MTDLIFSELAAIEIICLITVVIAFIFSIVRLRRRLLKASAIKRNGLILINLTAISALFGLILQPQFQSEQSLKVTLNTSPPDNFTYNENSFVLRSGQTQDLPGSNNQAMKPDPINLYQDRLILTAEQLLLKFPVIDELKIIGDGLTESEWRNFPNIKLDYRVPVLIEGVIQPHWDSTPNLGETLTVSGRLQSVSKKIHKAKLLDPGGDIVAETDLLASELFELTAQPKLTGNHKYQLQISDNIGQIISEQLITTNVVRKKAAKIMVLQSSPSFESKQLQNWAAENGSQFLLRSRISKDIYRSRSTNISVQQQKKNAALGLRKELFDQFDLLIVDGRELLLTSSAEEEAISLSIHDGLGVLILADQNLVSLSTNELPELLKEFELKALAQPTETIPTIFYQSLKRSPLAENFIPLSGLSIGSGQQKQASDLREQKIQTLVQTPQGHSIVAQVSKNRGRIAVSLLRQTHRLVTSGEKVHYSRLWNHLIKSIARRNHRVEYDVKSASHLSFEKQQVEICYFNSNPSQESPSFLHVSSPAAGEPHQILMQADALIKNRYCGYFWPLQMGWHIISNPNRLENTPKAFFVSSKLAWPAYQQQQKINATRAKQASFVEKDNQVQHYQKINQWIFWWLFIISASLIWLERKYYS